MHTFGIKVIGARELVDHWNSWRDGLEKGEPRKWDTRSEAVAIVQTRRLSVLGI